MKVKKMKELTLNKISIANLDNAHINEVKDGLRRIKGGNIIPSAKCLTQYLPFCPESIPTIYPLCTI